MSIPSRVILTAARAVARACTAQELCTIDPVHLISCRQRAEAREKSTPRCWALTAFDQAQHPGSRRASTLEARRRVPTAKYSPGPAPAPVARSRSATATALTTRADLRLAPPPKYTSQCFRLRCRREGASATAIEPAPHRPPTSCITASTHSTLSAFDTDITASASSTSRTRRVIPYHIISHCVILYQA
ncbi:hypothetical protein HYPSUDRAFT_207410 [Hypholoma sublateritium FD-334 SS-4]|uniref:Uncharacterized protein n=1 Tax=Hypholoma sublateritium (strain FD-334 SS-4) TaxID=945553 RepID=A0A0D2LYP3_HYPSF|nr:hypothetical protein HYPSUDRAFT_207410 [Hypholoma sublateritium FD-334 SS-4]